MDCDTFNELISAAVDRYLTPSDLETFLDHAGKCPSCRREYEAELLTKDILQSRLHRAEAPRSAIESIQAAIRREDAALAGVRTSWWQELLEAPPLKPALALGAIAVVVVLLRVVPGGGPSPVVSDVIAQSVSNYRDLLSGVLQPEVVSSEPESVTGFFSGKTEVPLLVPSIPGWTLVGGVFSTTRSGEPLAHLLFRRSGQLIYVCQANWDCVRKGQKISLPEHVCAALERNGLYAEQLEDSSSVVVWKSGHTVSAIVAPMPKQELLAYFTAAGNQPPR